MERGTILAKACVFEPELAPFACFDKFVFVLAPRHPVALMRRPVPPYHPGLDDIEVLKRTTVKGIRVAAWVSAIAVIEGRLVTVFEGRDRAP